MTIYTIAIVDDHPLIARALTDIIENFKQYRVLYEVGHGRALIDKIAEPGNIPDIVLLDVSMPVMDGFETAQWLKRHHPQVRVLTLSMHNDDQTLIRMIKAGARGCLVKNLHPLELQQALDSLVTRGHYYPGWVSSRVLGNIMMNEDSRKHIKLSDREVEFLSHASTELTYREIAEEMSCSPRTVEGYRDALFEKTGLKTRVALVVFAIKNGLIKV